MSDRGKLRFDSDGFLDMDQFDPTDPDEALEPAAYDALRKALLGADVPTPNADRFDDWVEQAVASGQDAHDTAALVPGDPRAEGDWAPPDVAWDDPAGGDVDVVGDAGDVDGLDDVPDLDDPTA
jgi:hypothetical protein